MKKTNALRILDRNKIDYEVLELESSGEYGSAVETAEKNNLDPARIFKTLVVQGDKNGIAVAVVSGDKQLIFKALAKITSDKKILMLPLKDLTKVTGYVRGGCSPLGMKKDFPVVLDDTAQEFDRIYVNAGKRGFLMSIKPADLIKVCDATVGKIAK